jgi:uncharacterized protein YbjQ (UPF0145 family)
MDKRRKHKAKAIELIFMLIGAVLVTVFLSITLNIPFYAIGIVFIILFFILGTGIWRWKQGDKQVKDVNIHPSVEKITVITDGLSSLDGNWECLGNVYGEAIVATHMVTDFWSSTKILIGGEPKGYHRMIQLARKASINRMKIEAWRKGANLITGHRLTTSNVLATSAELVSYGTAWKERR